MKINSFRTLNAYYVLFALLLTFWTTEEFRAQEEEEHGISRTQIGASVLIDSPFKSIMPEMTTSGLFALSVGHSPFLGSPVYFEFKAAWGNYSSELSKDIYYAKNGWWYPAEANYNSGLQKYLLGAKVMAGKEFRHIRGFATPQIGLLRMRSKTTVTYWDGTNTIWNNDNNDDGSKTASKTPLSQTGWVFGGEVGSEILLDKLFKIKSDIPTFRLVISGSILRGFKDYTYADVDKMLNQQELGDEDPSNYVQMSHPKVDEILYVKPTSSTFQTWGINIGLNINF